MIQIKNTRNGIPVIYEELDHVQSASMGLWVKAGSAHEAPAQYGISHLIEHMLFKGTETRSAREIAESVDRIGGYINAFTGKEATCYYIKALRGNLEQAWEIVTDLFLHSVFDPAELEKEKQVVYEEIKMSEDAPDECARDLLDQLVFQQTELENPVIGTVDSLAAISRDDILDYLRKEYIREHVLVALAGNLDGEEAVSYFDQRLAPVAGGSRAPWQHKGDYRPQYRMKVKDIEQSHICIGIPTVPQEHPLYYAYAVLGNLMGGTMSSRLFQRIREEKGLAYAVVAGHSSYTSQGIFDIYAGVAHQKVPEAMEAIRGELALLAREGLSEEEVRTSKEQLKSNYIFGQENVNSRMFQMGKGQLLLGRTRSPEEVLQRVDAVGMEELAQAIEGISHIENYCGVLLSDRECDWKATMLGE